MKKSVMLFAFTAVVISWIMVYPYFGSIGTLGVTGTKAAYSSVCATVSCTGVLTASRQQVINFGVDVLPENIGVGVGDTVVPGQRLLDIDKITTVEAFQSLSKSAAASDDTSGDTSAQGTADADNTEKSAEIQSYLSQYFSSGSTSSLPDLSGLANSDTDTATGSDSASEVYSASDENNIPAENIPDTVVSKISGVVTQINASDGCFAKATTPLLVIADLSTMQIRASVDESRISEVRIGQPATVSGYSLSKTYTGKVSKIFPTGRTIIDSSGTRTVVDVLIDLDQKDSSLIPGLNASVDIRTSENSKTILLPYEAVKQDSANKRYVFICQNGRAVRRDVEEGNEYTDHVEITKGISAGDTVILNRQDQLKNGTAVKINALVGENYD